MLSITDIERIINEDRASDLKTKAKEGQRYYEGEHDIKNYEIYYYDADGKLQKDKFKSNIRISHPFFTELVDQQVQYMLSSKQNPVRSDEPALQAHLDSYFGSDFWSECAELLTGVIAKGFDYMVATVDRTGKTKFEYVDGLTAIEVRAKDTDDGCEYFVFWYIDRIGKDHKAVKKIQVWDSEGVYFFKQLADEKIEPDNCCISTKGTGTNYRKHIVKTDAKGKILGKGFGFIPFFRLDNNRKQFSGLKPVKALIDDYDLMACSLSNNLQDFTDALYVVSGFMGANLDELVQNIKAKKHVGVGDGGSVDIKTVDIPYEARKGKLELDETCIYRFGMGFNSAQVGDGNITNIVIRSRYALLDLKCNKLESRLKQFLNKLLQVVLDEINRVNKTDFSLENVYYDFQREIMTNAVDNAQIELTEAQTKQANIGTLLSLIGTLDNETVIQQICDCLDIKYEDIKGKLPDPEDPNSPESAMNQLNGTEPEEGDLNV